MLNNNAADIVRSDTTLNIAGIAASLVRFQLITMKRDAGGTAISFTASKRSRILYLGRDYAKNGSIHSGVALLKELFFLFFPNLFGRSGGGVGI